MRSLTLDYEVEKSPEIEARKSKRVVPRSSYQNTIRLTVMPPKARENLHLSELDVRRTLFRGNPGYRAGKSAGEEDLK